MRRKNYLNYKEFIDEAPDSPGQVNVNHEDCPAGTDRKKRLYIRRLDDGYSVLAYCHHCGLSGAYSTAKKNARRHKNSLDGTVKKSGTIGDAGYKMPHLPRDFDKEPRNWPAKARAWCYKYGLTDGDIKRGQLGYSDSIGRVFLPVFGPDGPLVVQSRRLDESDPKPKYITYGNANDVVYVIDSLASSNDTICIVEDTISGLKVSHIMPVLVLLGSHLNDRQALVCSKYKKVFIFLDNDNPEIKTNALTMKKKLDMIVDEVVITPTNKDPKEYSMSELKEILNV